MTADFLHALFDPYQFEPKYVEIRYIKDRRVEQDFLPADQAFRLAASGTWDASHPWDVYFGVLPRVNRGGKASDCPFMVYTLWADIDGKNVGGREVAIRSAVDFPLRPNIIVDSGHGAHAYWLLRDPVEFSDAQKTMKGLARELHGDHVSDAPRVLRVPGTTNWKDREQPVPVRLIYFDIANRYRWWDFSDYTEQPKPAPVVAPEAGYTGDIPDWLNELIVSGAPKGKRSEAAFKAVLWLLRYGFSESDVQDIFDKYAIGEKYREKGAAGPAWLGYTIRAAQEAR